jgi:two-component system, sensor histidine kinase and response regulator
VTLHSLRERRYHLHILLAEDNSVNQYVAVRMLEKAGHTVTVVPNGKEALVAWHKQPYDLVLMDVQMPEMNGWEATQAIRESEKTTGTHIPIIALTAHAMKGDKERCLAAGMDLYLTKPIRTADLLAALDQVESLRVGPDAREISSPGADQTHLDLAAALERLDGDRKLFDQVAALFKEECPKLIAEIAGAFAAGDIRKVQSVAHALKGSSACIGANALSQAAEGLERLARTDDMDNSQVQMKVVEREVEGLMADLEMIS